MFCAPGLSMSSNTLTNFPFHTTICFLNTYSLKLGGEDRFSIHLILKYLSRRQAFELKVDFFFLDQLMLEKCQVHNCRTHLNGSKLLNNRQNIVVNFLNEK